MWLQVYIHAYEHTRKERKQERRDDCSREGILVRNIVSNFLSKNVDDPFQQ